MRVLAEAVVLLVVLGVCRPSNGEILVYKHTATGTGIEQHSGAWRVAKEVHKGYILVDLNYDDHTITQAKSITYETNARGKLYAQRPLDLDLVRVGEGSRLQWVILQKSLEAVGEAVTGDLLITAGSASNRNIGIAEKRNVASKLSGYVLSDTTEGGDREFGLFRLSLTLYPAWTYWANGEDKGGQDFETTTQMITDYLETRGYVRSD